MDKIEQFLAAKTFFVAGASNRQHKKGNKVVRALFATDPNIVAEPDFANIQDHAVEVDEDLLAKMGVGPVIAAKRWLEPNGIATASEQFYQDAARLALVTRRAVAECVTALAGDHSSFR